MTTISASFYHKKSRTYFRTKVNEGEVAIVAVQKDWKMKIRSFRKPRVKSIRELSMT